LTPVTTAFRPVSAYFAKTSNAINSAQIAKVLGLSITAEALVAIAER
jgi:hypothetical protein